MGAVMQVQCSNCGANLNVTDQARGQMVRCPKCKEVFAVKSPDSTVDATALLDKLYPPLSPPPPPMAESTAPQPTENPMGETPGASPKKKMDPAELSERWTKLPRKAQIGIAAGGILVLMILAVFWMRDSAEVALVKSSTMPKYGTAKIGKAFGVLFSEGRWKSFESDKGQRVVQFAGKVTERLHRDTVRWFLNNPQPPGLDAYGMMMSMSPEGRKKLYGDMNARPEDSDYQFDAETGDFPRLCPVGSTATFQWQLEPDGKLFRLSSIHSTAWKIMGGQAPFMTPVQIMTLILE